MKLFSKTAAVLTGIILTSATSRAVTTSVNTGSLGAAVNGTNADGVILNVAGPLAYTGDTAAKYGNGSVATPINTTVPFNAGLNPASNAPFTIEFWVNPGEAGNNGWAPVFNRINTSPRSGWTFFQRGSAAGGGWNFALYSGIGSDVGAQITGGASAFAVGSWTHVVGVWNGTTPSLYINGVDSGGAASGTGYVASTSATLSVGSYATGENSFPGSVDETAFYNSALSAAQIAAHFAAASNPAAGVYSNLVKADGAALYLQNAQVPEPTAAVLMALGLMTAFRRQPRRNK